jgi:hypothetical protein
MAYTDADGDPATFNDSTAAIAMPTGSTVPVSPGCTGGRTRPRRYANRVLFSTDGGLDPG